MDATLAGCEAKLLRAKHHIDRVQRDLAAYGEEQMGRVYAELNSASSERTYRLGTVDPMPLEFGVRIGEIAHLLRSALDNLVWQLVILSGGIPSRDNMFPIFASCTAYTRNESKYLAGVRQDFRAEIEKLQPHKAADTKQERLWILHQLNIVDKHRVVPTVKTLATGGLMFDDTNRGSFSDGNTLSVLSVGPVEIQPGAPLLTVQSKQEYPPRFFLVFQMGDEPPECAGMYISKLLNVVWMAADHDVFRQFRPFFA